MLSVMLSKTLTFHLQGNPPVEDTYVFKRHTDLSRGLVLSRT